MWDDTYKMQTFLKVEISSWRYTWWASGVVHIVKILPAVWETQVRSLGQQDPLERGTATHSSVLTESEEPSGLQSMGSQRVGHN